MVAIMSFVKRLFLRNKTLKIIAIVLACIAWNAINETISEERELMDIPISVLCDAGWAVLENSDQTADVLFRGSRDELMKLNRELIEIVADVRGRDASGALQYVLKSSDVITPTSARVVGIDPDVIEILLDRKGIKELPVKVDVRGVLPEGYEMAKAVCAPSVVKVSGPMHELEAMDAVRTIPVEIEGRISSFKVKMRLALPDTIGGVSADPGKVRVDVTIRENAAERVFPNVAIRGMVDADRKYEVSISPDVVKVTVEGRQGLLDALVPGKVQAFVDCAGLESSGRYELPVQVHVPPRVRIIEMSPAMVDVVVEALE